MIYHLRFYLERLSASFYPTCPSAEKGKHQCISWEQWRKGGGKKRSSCKTGSMVSDWWRNASWWQKKKKIITECLAIACATVLYIQPRKMFLWLLSLL